MLLLPPLLTLCLGFPLALAASPQDAIEGTWQLGFYRPGKVEQDWLQLELEEVDGVVIAKVGAAGQTIPCRGTLDRDKGRLRLSGETAGQAVSVDLILTAGRLEGTADVGRTHFALAGGRSGEAGRPVREPVVLPGERPVDVARDGLPAEVTAGLPEFMDEYQAVALSVACVVEGEVVDVRSLGWEDVRAGIPASARTMYRWASISKSMTALAALQLADRGRLDLDGDVRELVPEYDKGQAISTRQLLCHQGGVTHYSDMRVRTRREYEVEHPWADRILALDMFLETDLLHAPGSRYLYTTAGYVVLGAVVQRAGGGTYAEQVLERIARPLGMTSLRPDYQWEEFPHRACGYQLFGETLLESGDDDISWKLPGGGWISTVEDLARFGAGMMGPDLLDIETQQTMFERQRTSQGELTGYGLGVNVFDLAGQRVIAHSGGQLKTSTYLICCPDLQLAVAMMCNTEGRPLEFPAKAILSRMIEREGL